MTHAERRIIEFLITSNATEMADLAYPSTGEVIGIATKQIVATLTDEAGRTVESEKLLEIEFDGGKPVRAGVQFGIGRVVGTKP